VRDSTDERSPLFLLHSQEATRTPSKGINAASTTRNSTVNRSSRSTRASRGTVASVLRLAVLIIRRSRTKLEPTVSDLISRETPANYSLARRRTTKEGLLRCHTRSQSEQSRRCEISIHWPQSGHVPSSTAAETSMGRSHSLMGLIKGTYVLAARQGPIARLLVARGERLRTGRSARAQAQLQMFSASHGALLISFMFLAYLRISLVRVSFRFDECCDRHSDHVCLVTLAVCFSFQLLREKTARAFYRSSAMFSYALQSARRRS
jgi:hypothetical protein